LKFFGGCKENYEEPSLRLTGVETNIRTQDLPHTKSKCNWYTGVFGFCCDTHTTYTT